ncbi:hypothetical protein [Actinomadura gamaensis]|uniref:Uncharacterized protein n=1 Tax=Actinomadura gamaensis TaxID=1763541 RepID=A0ABV9U5R2_9ACTN
MFPIRFAPLPAVRAVSLGAAVVVAGAFLAPATATAGPCSGSGGGFGCDWGSPGGGSTGGGGGGTGGGGGGGGGGTTGEIPTAPGANAGGLPGANGNGPNAVGPAPISTNELAQRAANSALLHTPKVYTAPSGKTYVKVRTAFWVTGFEPVSTDPQTAANQTVQAVATPARVEWQLGDPAQPHMTCDDGGSKDGTTCSHTYQRSSTGAPGGAFQITATIVWTIHWTCVGAGCQQAAGDLPPMQMTSAPSPLVVGEIQTGNRR